MRAYWVLIAASVFGCAAIGAFIVWALKTLVLYSGAILSWAISTPVLSSAVMLAIIAVALFLVGAVMAQFVRFR